ncbi:hypothetical protein LTR86_007815 [Recurvomyces mirabilis]|nr:hypothetical protein LTR86_007815 [Recurvomyces mirabilis]
MAKHKHKRPPAGARTQAFRSGRQATTILRETDPLTVCSDPRTLPAKLRAHIKHTDDFTISISKVSHPTLADRFHSLPGELRAHIFTFLLVRPAKWSVKHLADCPKRTSNVDLIAQRQAADEDYHHHRCVHCKGVPYGLRHHWTLNLPPQYIAPWRSHWAPKPRNPYICSTCWDIRWRQCPDATRQHFRCFCARRQNLGVLLVCKKWWREAGYVFYTQNTFCFETAALFDGFFRHLRLEWRVLVARTSLMAQYDSQTKVFVEASVFYDLWQLFGDLTLHGLKFIELNAMYLTRLEVVRNVMNMNLDYGNTEIRFVLRRPERLVDVERGNVHVYPEFARGLLLRGGFPDEISRIARRQRRPWLKAGGRRFGRNALKNEVRRFGRLVEQINVDDDAWLYDEYDCSSVNRWAEWYYAIGYHTAWLPSRCTSGKRSWEDLAGKVGMTVLLDGEVEVMFGEGVEDVFLM